MVEAGMNGPLIATGCFVGIEGVFLRAAVVLRPPEIGGNSTFATTIWQSLQTAK